MITNLCPPGGAWCPADHHRNSYGYPVHFDLRDVSGQITSGLGWDNAEVVYHEVPCSDGSNLTPTDADFAQCACDNKRSVRDDNSNDGVIPPPPPTFKWADSITSWWVAFALPASSVSIDCGKGFMAMKHAGWTMNKLPVWIWENTNYQCISPVFVRYDNDKIFKAYLPSA